jgi:hypothetical protein
MKQNRKTLIIIFLCGFGTMVAHAQETITTAGGNATGSGGSASYTIGQRLYSSISGTNGTVTQGVQQPYEISVVTAIESSKEISLECMVYPNPTHGIIKLIIEFSGNENLRFQLYDINGVILQDKKVESSETEISMDNLSSSTYFLKVINNNQEVKVFKIIKN